MKRYITILITLVLFTQSLYANPSYLLAKALTPWSSFHQNILNDVVQKFNANPAQFVTKFKGKISVKDLELLKSKMPDWENQMLNTTLSIKNNNLSFKLPSGQMSTLSLVYFDNSEAVVQLDGKEMVIDFNNPFEHLRKSIPKTSLLDMIIAPAYAVIGLLMTLGILACIVGAVLGNFPIVDKHISSCKQVFKLTKKNLKNLGNDCKKAYKKGNVLQNEEFMQSLATLTSQEKESYKESYKKYQSGLKRTLNGNFLDCHRLLQKSFLQLNKKDNRVRCVNYRQRKKLCKSVYKVKECLNKTFKGIIDQEIEEKLSNDSSLPNMERNQQSEKMPASTSSPSSSNKGESVNKQ